MVTLLPVIPDAGVNEAIVGGPYAYRFLFPVALVPFGVLTVTFTLPGESAGAIAVSCVFEMKVTAVAVVEPNITLAPV
jgi:hypothetical protein